MPKQEAEAPVEVLIGSINELVTQGNFALAQAELDKLFKDAFADDLIPEQIVLLIPSLHQLVDNNFSQTQLVVPEKPYYELLQREKFSCLKSDEKYKFYNTAANTLLKFECFEGAVFYLTAALHWLEQIKLGAEESASKDCLTKLNRLTATIAKVQTHIRYQHFSHYLNSLSDKDKQPLCLTKIVQQGLELVDELNSFNCVKHQKKLIQQLNPWLEDCRHLWAYTKGIDSNLSAYQQAVEILLPIGKSLQTYGQYQEADKYYNVLIDYLPKHKRHLNPDIVIEIKQASAHWNKVLPAKEQVRVLLTLAYRARLKTLREQLKKELAENKAVTDIQQVYSLGVKTLVGDIAADIAKQLGKPPCAFSLIGMGSLSRLELAPYSDIDVAILVEKLEAAQHPYFQVFIDLLQNYLHLLGDSWMVENDTKQSLGLHIDTGDIQHLQQGDLIKAPAEMAGWVSNTLLVIQSADKTREMKYALAYGLQTPLLILGYGNDNHLVNDYLNELQQKYALDKSTPQGAIYNLIAKNSLYIHQEQFEEIWQSFQQKPLTLDIKKHLLAPLTYWCFDVALYHGLWLENLKGAQGQEISADIPPLSSWLNQLTAKKYLEASVADTIQRTSNQLQLVRLQQHISAGYSADVVELSTLKNQLNQLMNAILLPLYYSIVEQINLETRPGTPEAKYAAASAKPGEGKIRKYRIEPVFNPFSHALEKLITQYRTHTKASAIQDEGGQVTSLLKGLAYTLAEEQAKAAIFQQHYEQLPEVLRPLFLSGVEAAYQVSSAHSSNTYTQLVLNTLNTLPDSDGYRPLMDKQEEEWRQALHTLVNEVRPGNQAQRQGEQSHQAPILLFAREVTPPYTLTPKYYELKAEVACQLVDNNQRFKDKPKGQPGRHTVLPIQHEGHLFWAKLLPEQPGVEYMIEQLAWRISGGGVPQSAIWKVCTGKQPQAVQVFSAIPGIATTDATEVLTYTLEYALQKAPERLAHISMRSFTQTLLRVLLTNPEDDKGDDYFLVPDAHHLANTTSSPTATSSPQPSYRLWRIDNERAYYKPDSEEKGWFSSTNKLQVKSIIYCLDQMLQPLDREVLRDFLKLDPYALLKSWLKDLEQQHAHYQHLFNTANSKGDISYHLKLTALDENGEIKPMPSLLTLAIGKGLITELYNRLTAIQTVCRLNQQSQEQAITGMMLLQAVQPRLAEYYQTMFTDFPINSITVPALAYQRFNKRTDGLYTFRPNTAPTTNKSHTTSLNNHRQSTMPGLLAISQSLRLPALDETLVMKIAQGQEHSPKQALDELLLINNERRTSIIRQQLLNEKDSNENRKGLTAFRDLSVRCQLVILRDILSALDPRYTYFGAENLPKLAQQEALPSAPNLQQQQFILQAMAGIPFHQLNLTPFKTVLNETLLFPILRGAGRHLLALTMDECSLLTNQTLQLLQQECKNLQYLSLQNLDNPNFALLDSRNKVVTIEGRFNHLQTLKVSGCKQLHIIRITSPELERLEANDCPELGMVWVDSQRPVKTSFRECSKLEHAIDLSDKNLTARGTPSIAKRIARQYLAITTLDLSGNYIGAEGAKVLAVALEKNTTLTQLYLSDNRFGDTGEKAYGVINAYLARNKLIQKPTLTQLDLTKNNLGAEGAKVLAMALEKNTTLTQLDLRGNCLGDEGAKVLAMALEKNITLIQLDLRNNNLSAEGEKAYGVINAYLARNKLIQKPTLTQLDLRYNNLGDEGAKVLAMALEKNITLTQLDLRDNNLGDEGAKVLAMALEKNTTLTQLDLSDNTLGDESAKALATALEKNTTLTQLRLRNNKIGAEGAKVLAMALERNTTLTQLDLSVNKLGDESAKALATALEKNTTLTQLALRDNNLGAEGAKVLAMALEKNTTLTQLALRVNKLGDEGAKVLAMALEKNTTLTQLDLSVNKLGDEGISLLNTISKLLHRNQQHQARIKASYRQSAIYSEPLPMARQLSFFPPAAAQTVVASSPPYSQIDSASGYDLVQQVTPSLRGDKKSPLNE